MFQTIINPTDQNVTSGQYVNAMSAHREWASRPSDERYQSLYDLLEAAQAQKKTGKEKTTDRVLEVRPDGANLTLLGEDGRSTSSLTNWSFNQLAQHAGAPAGFLSSLSASTAALALNERLKAAKDTHKLYFGIEADGRATLRSLNGKNYARVHNADIVGRLIETTNRHPEWKLPMGYKDGKWGAELVPSGAYLGDRDMFIMLIDGNRGIDDPSDSTHQGLFRGVIIKNSEVGAAALTLDLFMFRRVCANNIIWGFEHCAGFRRRHVGQPCAIKASFMDNVRHIERQLNASTATDSEIITKAINTPIAPTKDDTIKKVAVLLKNQDLAKRAYVAAEEHESVSPRSHWGMVQGLTRVSQATSHQGTRYDIDKAASELLAKL